MKIFAETERLILRKIFKNPLTKKYFLIAIIISGLFTFYQMYSNMFTTGMLIGTYVNRNYNYDGNLVEIPYVSDTLILLPNNQFISSYWGVGKGKYRIINKLLETHLELSYQYEGYQENYQSKLGNALFATSISRLGFGTPKIILKEEENHYYEKID
ncbi:MAG TPA: hypothetical protein VEC36_13915 [Patescibacteria group bacterium]|nr:hypothetical protein [Patescibacteria group bacterium]